MKQLLTILFLFVFAATDGATLEVGKGKKYPAIEQAIAAASAGDIIHVYPGIYKGNSFLVNKPLHLRGINWPVLDGENKREILQVEANNVIIEGFEINNSGYSSSYDWAAVKVINSSYVTIRKNKLHNNSFGIYLQNASWTTIEENIVKGNPVNEIQSGNAIHCWKSDNIRIRNNTLSGHRDGIYFEFVTNSVIQGNNSFENIRYGLHFMFSNNDIYMNNSFKNNGAGVAVMFSKQVMMIANHFEDNWGSAAYGILLKEISDGVIKYNRFINNTVGVYMEGTNRINIFQNLFKSNGWALRVQSSCANNTVTKNNFIANTFDVGTNGSVQLNSFSTNYWDKYEGYDRNKDNYGDIPYQPVSLYSMVVEKIPAASILLRSFMVKVMDKAERVVPAITPIDLKDETPLMKPLK
ncbi:nitrous oxide reductase family maturation protein NosD [Aridibaculum aurantiacum]|uniref:nitrous oxide reductase family maturation protein NosD n=1 Tax=Aridibaculum aurantiacum TaxID=2810307 RepID=UPI001A97089A|nr:nitrous oxide reductase family maturation protein NosD [Aridibaculum aurantiacum]